jgi:nucleotide-binding universal stress UspA family protein
MRLGSLEATGRCDVRIRSCAPEHLILSVPPGPGRLIAGTSGSPGSLPALRYARDPAVPLLAVLAWVPPGGDLAERRCPSAHLRRLWADAVRQRLTGALDAGWGGVPPDLGITPVVIRGEPCPALVAVAECGDDLLVVGAGRRGALTRMWHAKVSRYCLSHARCPVRASRRPPPGRWASARPDRHCAIGNRPWTGPRVTGTAPHGQRRPPKERPVYTLACSGGLLRRSATISLR